MAGFEVHLLRQHNVTLHEEIIAKVERTHGVDESDTWMVVEG